MNLEMNQLNKCGIIKKGGSDDRLGTAAAGNQPKRYRLK